jgi:hypothetical protein
MEERRLTVFEYMIPRKIFGPKGTREQSNGEDYMKDSFMTSTPHQIIFERSNQEE